MTVYRYDGDKQQGNKTAYIVTPDIDNIVRKVGVGQTVDLDSDQVAELRNDYYFALSTDPVPDAPPHFAPLMIASEPREGQIPVFSSGIWIAQDADLGLAGDPGPPGKSVLSGSGAPIDSIGTDGEHYIDEDTETIWGPKISGTWAGTGPVSLIGPRGEKGDAGDMPVGAQLTTEKDQPNGYAGLDASGLLKQSELPPITITRVSVVASQAAQLALTAEEGDVAVRTDTNTTWIKNSGTARTIADWTQLATPTDAVLSVAGRTGAITLATADVSGLDAALAAKADDTDIDAINATISTLPGRDALIHQVTVAPTGTPADFNTTGTNDELVIESAIAALPRSGGYVCVRAGDYSLARAIRPATPNVEVWGEGASTLLRLDSTADDNIITVSASNVWIKRMKLDGNRTNIDVDHHGVSFITGSDNCGLRDVWITETVHHGTQSANATNLTLDNVLVTNTGKIRYPQSVSGDRPVSYWHFNELVGSTAADDTSANPGTYVGSPSLGTVVSLVPSDGSNFAVTFDGATQYVSIPQASSLDLTNRISLESWINPTRLPAAGSFASVISKTEAYTLQFNGPLLEFTIIQSGSRRRLQAPAGTIVEGTSYHVVGTYDGTTQRLYVNGREVASTALSGSADVTATGMKIASWDGRIEFFNGTIDEPAVYNVALSATQVASHNYAGVKARDGVGIVIGGGQGPCIGAKVINCRVANTGYHGFQIYRGTQHVEVVNCSASQTGQTRDTGNSMEIHPGTLDVHVSQFIGIGSASGNNSAGIVVDSELDGAVASRGVVLHSCWLEGHGQNGITVNGASDVTISSSMILNNGRMGSSSNKYGIKLKNGTGGDAPTRVHIFGNHIYDSQAGGSKTQNQPIGIYDGADAVNIFGNTFYGHNTADSIYVDGTVRGTINRFLNTGDGGLTVAGDLSGSLLSPTVVKLQGKSLPAPTSTEDQKTFIYDHRTGAYVWTSIAADVTVTALKARSHRKVHQDVVSLYADWMNLSSSTAATAANDAYGYVMRIPKTGNLRDILLHVNAPSGNISVWVYDVSSGGTTRNRLYTSGSIATPAQGWNIIADPNIAVTEGQLICLGFSVDNITATFGRYNPFPGSASAEIPAAFAPEGNVRMSCRKTTAFPDPGATWTTPGLTTVPFGIVARVS